MRRILATTIVLAAVGGFALLAGGASDEGKQQPKYWVELDNAFGLIEGADFKIAGVRAGKITEMKIDPRSHKALVGFQITVPGFETLKTDASCESRPQSLIGEYFIDCVPGRNAQALRPGSTIPVSRTFSTIPADLVNNILRLPQRERLRIVLNELGTGVAARGEDINAVVRRAVPALRETDRLLNLLANENQTLTELTTNADRVVGALAANRTEVSRFVREARDTSAASADRRRALAQSFRLLPAFLAELRPTMVELGKVADGQIPTLRDLDAAAPNLKAFLETLGPFSQASRPSLQSLGETADVGQETIPPARDTVRALRGFAQKTPELGRNLAIVLEDLYDRDRAVEPDARSPGGKGFNGFEALLRYAFVQSQAINIFDRNGYILKVAIYDNRPCGEYHDAQAVQENPSVIHECASVLGPTQPGVTTPDPTAGNSLAARNNREAAAQSEREAAVLGAATQAAGPSPGAQDGGQAHDGQPAQSQGPAIDIPSSLRSLLGARASDGAARQRARADGSAELMSYLFAP